MFLMLLSDCDDCIGVGGGNNDDDDDEMMEFKAGRSTGVMIVGTEDVPGDGNALKLNGNGTGSNMAFFFSLNIT